jgi:ABC-type antimicrobial peptide transport system permease subunit
MQDGNENFEPTDNQRVDTNFLHNAPIAIDDAQLTKPYLFKDVKVSNSNIPLVVSYSTAENMLGLSQLSSNASAKEQYDRIQQLYRQTSDGSLTISTCYRNSESQSQIDLAISQAAEVAKNVNTKDYQKPKLIYGLPAADSCDKATIVSDTRTDAEKKLQVAQDQFNADFGQIVVPIQQKITFQVIGLSPSEASSDNTTFGNLLSGIVGSSLTNGASVIPSDLLNQVPNVSTIKSILLSNTGTPLGASRPSYYVEFSNADDARAFISEKSCTTRADGTCASPGRLFQLVTSGNNSIALQDLQKKLTNIISIAALAIVIFAIIIMTTMVGRTIADSRHETAVFRAIGAKRGDIAIIYTLYTLLITLFIAVISATVGVGVAYYLNVFYNQNATLQAKLLFDAVNTKLTFNLFDVNISLIGMAIAIIFITGLLSMIIPVIRNIRRNPIRDMREE